MHKSSHSFLVAGLFSLLLLGLSACENGNGKQVGQNDKPTSADQSTQTNAQDPGKPWPPEIPDAAPRFKFGHLDEVLNNDTPENLTWVLKFSNTSENNVVAYEAVLAAAGFKPQRMPMGENSTMIVGLKDKLTVTVNYTATTVTVGVNLAK